MGPLSAIYRAILAARSFYYAHINKPGRLPSKVISIGNITLGGTGKTPAVIAVAEHAKALGFNPCILTRGYKGKAKGPCFVSKRNRILLTAEEAGDEAFLMAEKLSGIPVVIGKDRYLAGKFALNKHNNKREEAECCNLFILDDGFQHIALHRDMDVLLIDATNPFSNERLFPEGRLREPIKAISRADIIVLTKSDTAEKASIDYAMRIIKRHNPDALIYMASHKPTSLVTISGEAEGIEKLQNKKVYVFTGIANPSYFKSILTSKGATVARFKKFRDHHKYTQREIDRIIKSADGMEIITTEKDLVKLKGMHNTEDIRALKIEFSIEEEFYAKLFEKVQAAQ
ncbi:MAG: tetraacyldisaccharide 4'-kinase [Nitrospirae bacterium]|nr:tetraacyldisaccharide 4'-kinase [Nitrospirota bacterium]